MTRVCAQKSSGVAVIDPSAAEAKVESLPPLLHPKSRKGTKVREGKKHGAKGNEEERVFPSKQLSSVLLLRDKSARYTFTVD